MNRAIKAIDQADLVFLVIDAQEGLSDQDKKIAALPHDQGRGIIMVLNKWDTLPPVKNQVQAVQDRIRFLFAKMEYAPIIPVSAKDGTGVDKLLDTADFGILRLIVDKSAEAIEALTTGGFTTRLSDVVAVEIVDTPGSLARVMELFQKSNVNIEYLYASLEGAANKAVVIFKLENLEQGLKIVADNGLSMVDKF